MANKYTALILFFCYSAISQPLTPSELAWRKNRTNNVVFCTTTATNIFLATVTNSPINFQLLGSGSIYSISSTPSHGSIDSLNPSTGAGTYTPALNYTGSDQFLFEVTSNFCKSQAIAYVAVLSTDTNSPDASVCLSVTNVGSISEQSSSGGCITACSTPGTCIGPFCDTNVTATLSPSQSGDICAYFTPSSSSCEDVSQITYVTNFNGGNYTFTNSGNWFQLMGQNGGVLGCSPPSNSVVSFYICNDQDTNRTFIMLGSIYYNAQTCGGPIGFVHGISANLDINSQHFTFSGPQVEIIDCPSTSCGSFSTATISNAFTVLPHTSLNFNLNTRLYRIDGLTPNNQTIIITNIYR